MPKHLYSTLPEAIDSLRSRGFTADFKLAKGTTIISANGQSYKADELTIVEHYRFEGISDPDDSSVLYVLESADGIKGLLVDAYGVYANASIGVALQKTRDMHGEPT